MTSRDHFGYSMEITARKNGAYYQFLMKHDATSLPLPYIWEIGWDHSRSHSYHL